MAKDDFLQSHTLTKTRCLSILQQNYILHLQIKMWKGKLGDGKDKQMAFSERY